MTGRAGRLVPLEETIDSCERILRDDFGDRAEGDFYMIGAIDDLDGVGADAGSNAGSGG
jgi:F-type H+-transporting ATPase subunit beta